ncbi:MAG: dihydropteroate synthase [Gammaproteobacteria bacterium]|nr:dihydropteroate synthase [Gammaproteobacteria bacterium]
MNTTTPEHLIFITGRLAERPLARILAEINSLPFSYEIRVLGVTVAALLTTDMIARRLGEIGNATRVIVPGRCRGALEGLSAQFSIPFERGPEELKDLPQFFGAQRRVRDLTEHACLIFAEIVDAPHLEIEGILQRAARYRADGADVIDLGCLPDIPYPHLAESVQALKHAGYQVSVDSLETEDLRTGGRAGADYLFSLSEDSLWLAEEASAIPVLIGRDPRDLDSLARAIDTLIAWGKPFYADPILDPIHHGFTASVLRYQQLRERYPGIDILMGIGNLTELTHSDTLGVNTLLLGIMSELRIGALLTTEVSGHCRTVVRELELGRRVLFAAREEGIPPRHVDEGLLALHERKPYPYTAGEIAEFAEAVKDKNFRIQVADDGIHIYNGEGCHVGVDPYELFPHLNVAGDGAHAFYLGLELARAQIALQLGKRYQQDEELTWGVVRPRTLTDKLHFAVERSTLKARKAARRGPGK